MSLLVFGVLLFCLQIIVQDQVVVIAVDTSSCGTCAVLLELSRVIACDMDTAAGAMTH
jgi:hypothetical protein